MLDCVVVVDIVVVVVVVVELPRDWGEITIVRELNENGNRINVLVVVGVGAGVGASVCPGLFTIDEQSIGGINFPDCLSVGVKLDYILKCKYIEYKPYQNAFSST